jgi:hypothetical protein
MDDLERIEGLFVGQLTARELRTFERAIADGEARRSYEGGGGFLGLARVRLSRPVQVCPYWPGCGCGTQSGPHTCEWRARA